MNVESTDCLEISVDGAVAHLRFTRPEKLNCFDEELHTRFPQALAELSDESAIEVLVISGQGKAFSAGGDFQMMREAYHSRELRNRLRQEATDIYELMTRSPFPILVAVAGAAVGLGATIVALADIVVASKNATFADPHVAVGLAAGDGGILGWSHAIGVNRAKRYLLTGDFVSAEQAFAMGLVSDLVDNPEDVLQETERLAAKIAGLPGEGVRYTKKAFNRLQQQYNGAVFDMGIALEMQSMTHPEHLEVVDKIYRKT